MPGQDLSLANIRVMTAQSAVPQYAAVIGGTLEDTCTMPGGANATGFVGFAVQSASSGQTIPVQIGGGIAKAIAGASVSKDVWQVLEGTDGRLKNVSMTNSNSYVVAKCLRTGVDGDVVPVLIWEFVQNGAA